MDLIQVAHGGREWPVYRGDDGQPRAKDLDVAEWLGYARPAKIRDLIKSLERTGKLKDLVVLPEAGKTHAGGRPAEVFYLTEAQALKVAAKSETDVADQVLDAIIAVFLAARDQRPQIPSARPQGFAPTADFEAQIRDCLSRCLGSLNELHLQGMADRQSRSRAGADLAQRLDALRTLVDALDGDAGQIAQQMESVQERLHALEQRPQQDLGPVLAVLDTIRQEQRRGVERLARIMREQRTSRARPRKQQMDVSTTECAAHVGLSVKGFRLFIEKHPDLVEFAGRDVSNGEQRRVLRWNLVKVDAWFVKRQGGVN